MLFKPFVLHHCVHGGHSYMVDLPFCITNCRLPFSTRDCIPYVRSGLYQLVIPVKGIRVCALVTFKNI